MYGSIYGLPVTEFSDIPQANGYPTYSERELARRHVALREILDREGLDVALVGGAAGPHETSVQYFTNWAPLNNSYFLFPREGEPVLFVRLYNHLEDAKTIAAVDDVRYGGDTDGDQADAVAAELAHRGLGSAGIGGIGPIPFSDEARMSRERGGRFVDLTGPYQQLRFVKSEEELRFIGVASLFNDRAIEALAAELRPGLPEYAIARIIEDAYLAERGTNLIHFTLATAMQDPDRAVPHQVPPDRVLRGGDVFVTEISTLFWGYAGQVLRTFTIGASPTDLFAELHTVALDAYEALTGVLRAGTTVGELLDAAEVIHDAGFTIEDDLVHGYSGGYLPPILRTRRTRGATHPDDFAYPADAIVVVQPNVTTLDSRAGVQVGNSVRITPEAAISTQHAPMVLIECAT